MFNLLRLLYYLEFLSEGQDVKKNNNTTPSLDLSFAYGTAILKRLTQRDIDLLEEKDRASTGDTTIRAVTSLFYGKRRISGLHDLAPAAARESSAPIDDEDLED